MSTPHSGMPQAPGGPIRLVNLQSNRTVDAMVTGPGAASANPGF